MQPRRTLLDKVSDNLVVVLAIIFGLLVLTEATCGQSIDGPAEVELMHPAWFSITGLSETASTMIWPSDVIDVNAEHIKYDSILFWSDEPGTFTIHAAVIDWDARRTVPLIKTVVVKGEKPPEPDPPLPPPPNPSGTHWQVKFFTEKHLEDNLSNEQIAILNGLKFRDELEARGHRFMGCFDVSSASRTKWPLTTQQRCATDSSGRRSCYNLPLPTPPAEIGSAWWDKVRGDPLPRIAIAPLEGGDVQDFPLPATEAEVFKLLEEAE